ncbi:MAG: VOC family protein [Anaerolineaceae bacterium]|nr:VOC family protein [Anaerolineaceae bacterium]
MSKSYIPPNRHALSAYLIVENADRLVQFVKDAFDAKEDHNIRRPDGKLLNAQLRIDDSTILIAEAYHGQGPFNASLYLYVPDVDAAYRRALDAGAISLAPPMDAFYGDRSCGVQDPVGNHWWIAAYQETIAPDELQKRANQMFQA